jgi:hypothetical protein
MDGNEMSEILREIGGEAGELARRLDVRPDTVRRWLNRRREIAGPQSENWRSGGGGAVGQSTGQQRKLLSIDPVRA